MSRIGPIKVLRPNPEYESCYGCKFYRQEAGFIVKAPVTRNYCMHEDCFEQVKSDQRLIETVRADMPQQSLAHEAPCWCPFLR